MGAFSEKPMRPLTMDEIVVNEGGKGDLTWAKTDTHRFFRSRPKTHNLFRAGLTCGHEMVCIKHSNNNELLQKNGKPN